MLIETHMAEANEAGTCLGARMSAVQYFSTSIQADEAKIGEVQTFSSHLIKIFDHYSL